MSSEPAHRGPWHKVAREFVIEFDWIHITLGLIGNLSFLVGSVFFLWESLKSVGVWLFIIGASGMLVGSIGGGIVKYETQDS